MIDSTPDNLPADLLVGANLRGNEYGWAPESFAIVVAIAADHGYACLGGQFQFRLPDAICEMYWLRADSTERAHDESWNQYSRRSCDEVGDAFNRLMRTTDFRAQASDCEFLKHKVDAGFDSIPTLMFVAYFVTEQQMAK
jgi:hypothetical protein